MGYALIALICGAGLRIDEALSLTWRNVDLGTAHAYVIEAKTPKGVRRIPPVASSARDADAVEGRHSTCRPR